MRFLKRTVAICYVLPMAWLCILIYCFFWLLLGDNKIPRWVEDIPELLLAPPIKWAGN